MNSVYLLIVVVLAIGQIALPIRFAFLPLIFAGAHLGGVEILPELTPARLIVVIGLVRALAGGFFLPNGRSKLDIVFVVFSFFALLSSLGHESSEWVPSPLSARAGLVLNVFGTYLYGRAYLPDIASFRRFAYLLPLVLIPLAICMTIEKRSARNLYANLGISSEDTLARGDRIRASGPFRHPILAGCAGATALPFAFLLWQIGRKRAALAAAVTFIAITLASSSSGPLAAVGVTLGAILLWRWRERLRLVLILFLLMAITYVIISGRGPWYLMASIDLVGGSTGWHRAKLMDQGFTYLNEWWLYGTDYTRHWMASGMRRNPNHVDITNYYLQLGVHGGLPLMLSLVGMIVISYKLLVGRMVEMRQKLDGNEIVLWCAGASLATHAISFVSIAYFDQMYVFFYLLLGAIPGLVNSPSKPNVVGERETANRARPRLQPTLG